MNRNNFLMQVLDVVKRWPEVRKISFVAHSLGGLVARYAIGRLYELFPKMETAGLSGKCSSREHLNELTQHPDQHFEARVAGLEPMNFVTFATPHLGSRGHRQVIVLVYAFSLFELHISFLFSNYLNVVDVYATSSAPLVCLFLFLTLYLLSF